MFRPPPVAYELADLLVVAVLAGVSRTAPVGMLAVTYSEQWVWGLAMWLWVPVSVYYGIGAFGKARGAVGTSAPSIPPRVCRAALVIAHAVCMAPLVLYLRAAGWEPAGPNATPWASDAGMAWMSGVPLIVACACGAASIAVQHWLLRRCYGIPKPDLLAALVVCIALLQMTFASRWSAAALLFLSQATVLFAMHVLGLFAGGRQRLSRSGGVPGRPSP